MNDDHALLQRYVREGEQEAFRTLVSRYAGLVYSAALRHVREPALAEEAAQNVFTLLAMKGRSVPREASLAGWLHKSACYIARHLSRSEARRRMRESVAADIHAPADAEQPEWEDLQKVLDESLSSLKSDDREAVLLRFSRGLSLREVGGVLQTSEDGARMKINRALEKLRGLLARRGITSTAAALSGTLAAHAVASVPIELTRRIASYALNPSSHTTTVTNLALMSTKAKVVFLTAGAALTAVVGTPIMMQREKDLRAEITTLEDRITGLNSTLASTVKKTSSPADAQNTAANANVNASKPAAKADANDMASQMAQAKALIGAKGKAGFGSAVSSMMKMPGMKELMKSQTKPIVEKMYADLLDGLWQLNPEQRAKALDALLEPMSEAQMGAMEMLKGGATGADAMKEISAKAKAANERRDATLKEIVNDPEKWAQFARYEESSGERMKLTQLREELGKGDPSLALTESQEEKLMNMMFQARKDTKADVPFERETRFDPELFTEEALNERKAKSLQMDEKITAEAQSILKPEQMEAFKDSLKNSRAMEAAAMDMARAMFGPPEQEEAQADK